MEEEMAKMDPKVASEIRDLWYSGVYLKDIAKKVGKSEQAISAFAKRHKWDKKAREVAKLEIDMIAHEKGVAVEELSPEDSVKIANEMRMRTNLQEIVPSKEVQKDKSLALIDNREYRSNLSNKMVGIAEKAMDSMENDLNNPKTTLTAKVNAVNVLMTHAKKNSEEGHGLDSQVNNIEKMLIIAKDKCDPDAMFARHLKEKNKNE